MAFIFSPKSKWCSPPTIKAGLARIAASPAFTRPTLIWFPSTPHAIGLLLIKECRQPVLQLGEDRAGVAFAVDLLFDVRNVSVEGRVFRIPSCVSQFFRSLQLLPGSSKEDLSFVLVFLAFLLGGIDGCSSQYQRERRHLID